MHQNTSKQEQNLIGIILSGGAGLRMGGIDKGLQHYQGKPLVEHVINAVSGQVSQTLLCVNRNSDQYAEYGFELVHDSQDQENQSKEPDASYQGPVAGIVAAIQYLRKTQTISPSSPACLLVSPCDAPHLPNNHALTLIEQMRAAKASSAVVYDGERQQNLHCLIEQSAWASIEDFYASGGRAMHRWHKKNGSVNVNFIDQAACFLNINTGEYLA